MNERCFLWCVKSSHIRRFMMRNGALSNMDRKVDDDKSSICQYVHKTQVFFHVYSCLHCKFFFDKLII